MRRPILVSLLCLVLTLHPTHARAQGDSEARVLQDFERILDLWRDGKYAELYERTLIPGRESREQFARRLSAAPRRPACCWEKMQNAKVSFKGERAAVVKARLGFEGGVSGTEYVTKGIKLKKEDEVWMISQTDLFALGNLVKKRTRYRYVPVR
ncbi:hypothetical protein [Geomesophilobacter sediminis]|uniref:DUF4440 domain-containing protein n=1 Tax=Geomesophilobacter sediminis TaxID=2798584 RepID=A0A8J7IPF3_9BACT|nr:hypothetical protein [Geomesophilobacter sediminis]MBJ6725433.1 hypothetical protein [Geomesophilobacter sediminis]